MNHQTKKKKKSVAIHGKSWTREIENK